MTSIWINVIVNEINKKNMQNIKLSSYVLPPHEFKWNVYILKKWENCSDLKIIKFN